MKIIRLIVILLFFTPLISSAQNSETVVNEITKVPQDIVDGSFEKKHNQNKTESFEYPEINEKDIVWSRTIWREIDLNHKMNHHFYYPDIEIREHLNSDKMSLIDVVMEAIQGYTNLDEKCSKCSGTGEIDATNNVLGDKIECTNCLGTSSKFRCFQIGLNSKPGNEFKYGLKTKEEKMEIGVPPADSVYVKDEYGQRVVDTREFLEDGSYNQNYGYDIRVLGEPEAFKRTQVVAWKVKEEWFFDKKRSVMDVRIVGLAPCWYVQDTVNNTEKLVPLFWIYYPDFRDVLLNTRVTNYTKNNAQERSFLGVFEKRMFVSRITMESNIMNREISDYMIGLDALLESERIKEEIFNIEHDMWEY